MPHTRPSSIFTLIQGYVDATEWVPHPYCPPSWAISSFSTFSGYICHDEQAFELCRKWQKENDVHCTALVKDLFKGIRALPVAHYNCVFKQDYLYVGIAVDAPDSSIINVNSIWKSQDNLAFLARELYPDAEREYSPSWLGSQRIDVFLPSVNVAIEYQGEQHFRAVEFFGGEESFLANQRRDEKKRELCKLNGVKLIEWPYHCAITMGNLIAFLESVGVQHPERSTDKSPGK